MSGLSERLQRAVLRGWSRLTRRPLAVWHHPDFRLPLPEIAGRYGLELRRADFARTTLEVLGATHPEAVHAPLRATMAQLERVHDAAWLEAIAVGERLADVFGADAADMPVDEVLSSVRLGCGATIEAAHWALANRLPALNLFGGFHHAFPCHGAGLCALNDIGVAIADLRAHTEVGRIAIIDLDAHPPDGLAAMLPRLGPTWVGSLSGSDWGALEGVDETLVEGADDAAYLAALDALLARVPDDVALFFVIAGGDVLAGDKMGLVEMTPDGVRERDARVLERVGAQGSVWLPGGGYHPGAWRLLAGTGLVLAGQATRRIHADFEPLAHRFAKHAEEVSTARLQGEAPRTSGDWLDLTDLDLELDADPLGRTGPQRLLGYYTASGLEYALFRYGILSQLQRLGYHGFQVLLSQADTGDRLWVEGRSGGQVYRLLELEVSRGRIGERGVLYVNWLTLRHPLGHFGKRRPRLPGQDVPGLGLADEAGLMLGLMADRLELEGVAMRPAHFHVAYAMRHHFQFVDPVVQGQFEALQRDLLGPHSLLEVTHAVQEGRIAEHGAPWSWPASPMVGWRDAQEQPPEDGRVQSAREACVFTLVQAG